MFKMVLCCGAADTGILLYDWNYLKVCKTMYSFVTRGSWDSINGDFSDEMCISHFIWGLKKIIYRAFRK